MKNILNHPTTLDFNMDTVTGEMSAYVLWKRNSLELLMERKVHIDLWRPRLPVTKPTSCIFLLFGNKVGPHWMWNICYFTPENNCVVHTLSVQRTSFCFLSSPPYLPLQWMWMSKFASKLEDELCRVAVSLDPNILRGRAVC